MMINSGRCAACKNQRRKCPSDCIFSPYFPANDPQRFASVHRIYGGSNVGKMLQQIPSDLRGEAVDTLHFEAKCRIEDPVYGCVGMISQLHQQIQKEESELYRTQALIAFHKFQTSSQILHHQPNLDHHHLHHVLPSPSSQTSRIGQYFQFSPSSQNPPSFN